MSDKENVDLSTTIRPEQLIPGIQRLRKVYHDQFSALPGGSAQDKDLRQFLELYNTKQEELDRLLEDLKQAKTSIRINATEIISLRGQIEAVQKENLELQKAVDPSPAGAEDFGRFLNAYRMPSLNERAVKELIVKLSIVD